MKQLLGKNLAQVSKKDKPWNKHKGENSCIGQLYGEAESFQFQRYSERMSECSKWLEFAETKQHDKKLKLTRANFCHVRHCPICQWRKSLARIARFMSNLPEYLEQCPEFGYIYVVLTTRNCPMSELRETIRAQNKGVEKLLKRLKRAGVTIHGYIRTNEVTKGQDGNPHPHVNLILAVNKSYFTDRTYIPKMRWVALWRECMKLSYDPSVFVSRVRKRRKKAAKKASAGDAEGIAGIMGKSGEEAEDLLAGVLEVSKYAVKPEDMEDDAEFLYGITEQCARLRFLGTGGCLKDIFKDRKKGKGDGDEDISSEEMLLKSEEGDGVAVTNMRQLYLWYRGRGYLLKLRRRVQDDEAADELEFREGLTKALRDSAKDRSRS